MKREQEECYYPRLFLDYRDGIEGIRDLYFGHFKHFEDTRDKYTWLTNHFPGKTRETLVQELNDYNLSLDASPETLENIQKLKDPKTVVVAAGQQAAVFTGPLYTVYKAITAIKLAEHLTNKGISAVPVFWIASEDHDFREVNHIHLQDMEGVVEELALSGENGRTPIEHVPVDLFCLFELIDQLEEYTPPTEFKEHLFQMLRESAEKSDSLTRWFGRLMAWLFNKQGLIIFNPLLKEIRKNAGNLLSSICLQKDTMGSILTEREKVLQQMGYHLQVKREEGQLNLFALRDKRRAALFEKNGRVFTRQEEVLGTVQETAEEAKMYPERFSPNVITRPLIQETLLPTVMQVCGPAETSYFAQLIPLYPLFNLKSPVFYPRPSVTLLEPRMSRYMKKYCLTEKDLFHINGARLHYLEEKEETSISKLFESLEKAVEKEYEKIKKELSHISSQLGDLSDTNRNIVLKDIAYLREKAEEVIQDKHKVALGHFYKLESACHPVNQLQERVYNIFPYLIKYGPSFWEKLIERFPLQEGHHFFRWNP